MMSKNIFSRGHNQCAMLTECDKHTITHLHSFALIRYYFSIIRLCFVPRHFLGVLFFLNVFTILYARHWCLHLFFHLIMIVKLKMAYKTILYCRFHFFEIGKKESQNFFGKQVSFNISSTTFNEHIVISIDIRNFLFQQKKCMLHLQTNFCLRII